MKVPGIGNSAHNAQAAARMQAKTHARRGVQAQTTTQNGGETAPLAGTEEKQRGVIRLLQEGHFKGVADVRLRINFYDELSAIEHASLAGATGDEAPKVLEAVNAEVETLVASGELTEEQTAAVLEAQGTFNAAANQLVEEFQSSGGASTDDLLAGLRGAFDDFLESLTPILTPAPAAEEPAVEEAGGTVLETAAVDGEEVVAATALTVEAVIELPAESLAPEATEETEPSAISAFLESIGSVFESAVEGLSGALEAATTLPPLSEPSGNGVAYAKFLEMYNELRGVVPAEGEAPEGAEGLDAVT